MSDSRTGVDIGINNLDDSIWKPKYGLAFVFEQQAYDFYNVYGGRVGFGIRRDTRNKNRHTGEITSRIFVCSKEGFRGKDKRDDLTKNPRQEVRTGCQARMSIKLNRHIKKYVVNEFKEEHNHPFVIPEAIHMLPSQRKMSASQAIEVELAEESGIPLKSAYELLGRQAGSRESLGYTKQDQKNYLRTKRQRQLAFGEAGAILKYFQNQILNNPSFFNAVQLDGEEQMTNIFWADAKMIIDYGLFGDVVSFDTTYKTNKEDRPFAVFVGFNHHRETVLFGAALMYDEMIESFIWLFETFLEAMSKKAPKTIFTDQNAAMANAISNVMPDTYHRLCTWHLMTNAVKHVNSDVRSVISKCIHYIEEEDEFLAAWDQMLIENKMHKNNWLNMNFNARKKWAKTYVRWAWSAGMRSTQLSKSINSSLKDYLKSDLDVMQFFKHFERVLYDKRYKELEAEYALSQKLPKVTIPVKMLINARNIYTKTIFKEFQAQYVKSLEASIETCIEDDENFIYTILVYGHSRKRQVMKQRDNTLSCSCRLFEMRGILCSHAIKVLRDVMNIMDLPSKYILKRWTRKVRAEFVQDMHGRDIQADVRLQQTSWYRSLCSIFTRASSRASESKETYNVAFEKANELITIIEDMLSNGQPYDKHTCEGNADTSCLNNANVIQVKGLEKKAVPSLRGKRRTKSALELALAKTKKRSSNSKSTSQTSQVLQDILHMGGNVLCPPMVYHAYPGFGMPNPIPWTTYEESQNTFQTLPQHNSIPTSYAFSCQGSQVSNNSACTEVYIKANEAQEA